MYPSKLSIKGLLEVFQYSKIFACEVINGDYLIHMPPQDFFYPGRLRFSVES